MTQYEEMQLRKIAPLQDGIDPKQGERENGYFLIKITLGTLTNFFFCDDIIKVPKEKEGRFMQENNICPGCGRHCDLERPHCGRGEEYRRTGKMPEHQRKQRDQEMHTANDSAAGIDDRLIISLRDLHHTMRSLYEGKASQKRILIILNETETITQRDLTERLGIQPGSASEILSKLEGSGWIVRTQNESDRRTTDISLTDSGREIAEEALKQRRKRHEEMFSCLSGEEKQELLSLLDKVRCDWKKRYRENENTFKYGHRHGCRDDGGHHEGHGHRDDGGYHDGHGHHGGSNGHGGR